MDSVRLRVLAITLGLGLAGSSMAGAGPHDGLRWNGPGTCVACHQHQAAAVHESAHYQWQGPAPYSVNGPVLQGKFRSAFNSYCINITGNWGACGGCHVGLGALPEPSVTQSQLENIDCLICHQEQYKRRKVNGVFVPDTAAMTIHAGRTTLVLTRFSFPMIFSPPRRFRRAAHPFSPQASCTTRTPDSSSRPRRDARPP